MRHELIDEILTVTVLGLVFGCGVGGQAGPRLIDCAHAPLVDLPLPQSGHCARALGT